MKQVPGNCGAMMVIRITILIFLLCSGTTGYAATLTVERGSDLQSVLDYAQDGDTVKLGAKTFEARPTLFVDSLCGNCEDPRTGAKASFGFIVRNKSLVIVGSRVDRTRLVTNAGYGIFFVNSPHSQILNLSVTGGRRDADGNATDAAIVVRNSIVEIIGVDIIGNNDRASDTTVVVGIAGIVGREGSEILIRNCNIRDNSWDGIALYRGALASISDCTIADGRGAGIGITWDATCTAYRNEITGYWKGIGAFGASRAIIRNNRIHENLGWGVIATGQSQVDITNNVVHHNGNCGIATWSNESRGRIANNIITGNGWRQQWVCPCVGLWNNGDWAKWEFSNNIVFGNSAGNYEGIWDQSGRSGNLNVDPLFVGDDTFRLSTDSPGRNAGDSTILNRDGTISHIGISGGPQAKPDM